MLRAVTLAGYLESLLSCVLSHCLVGTEARSLSVGCE